MKRSFETRRALARYSAIGALVVAGAAQAAGTGVDVTDTVATIGAQLGPIGLVGVAVLGVIVAVKAFRWVRGALS